MSPCEILCTSVKSLWRYGLFSIFQDGDDLVISYVDNCNVNAQFILNLDLSTMLHDSPFIIIQRKTEREREREICN